jgi:ATP phosphoribosyltransferase regulatory subunit
LGVFSSLIKKRGGIELVEDAAKGMEGTGKYLDYFMDLFERLEAYNLRSRVNIDLTTLREMEYYNGTVFDIYVGGVGVPVGGGGRYDAMMEEFGMGGAKATGFAVSIDLCVRALDSKSIEYGASKRPLRILFSRGYEDQAIRLAEELRKNGKACTVDAYKGEREGVFVGEDTLDLATGETFEGGGRTK